MSRILFLIAAMICAPAWGQHVQTYSPGSLEMHIGPYYINQMSHSHGLNTMIVQDRRTGISTHYSDPQSFATATNNAYLEAARMEAQRAVYEERLRAESQYRPRYESPAPAFRPAPPVRSSSASRYAPTYTSEPPKPKAEIPKEPYKKCALTRDILVLRYLMYDSPNRKSQPGYILTEYNKCLREFKEKYGHDFPREWRLVVPK